MRTPNLARCPWCDFTGTAVEVDDHRAYMDLHDLHDERDAEQDRRWTDKAQRKAEDAQREACADSANA